MRTDANERICKFFAQRAPGSLGITQLQKLIYMADLHAREYLGQPISTYAYTFYKHGPFDKELYGTVEVLDGWGWVRQEQRIFSRGESKRVFNDGPTLDDFGFSPAESHILDYVVRAYAHLPLNELLKIAYATAPMQAAHRNGRVPMEIVDNTAKRALGYDLEDVLGEESEIQHGNFEAASDFFDALLADLVTENPSEHPSLH
jgi:hypothetical protein